MIFDHSLNASIVFTALLTKLNIWCEIQIPSCLERGAHRVWRYFRGKFDAALTQPQFPGVGLHDWPETAPGCFAPDLARKDLEKSDCRGLSGTFPPAEDISAGHFHHPSCGRGRF